MENKSRSIDERNFGYVIYLISYDKKTKPGNYKSQRACQKVDSN